MSDYALGRCLECDRLIYNSEGKMAAHLYSILEKCEKCIEKEQEKDMEEMENEIRNQRD